MGYQLCVLISCNMLITKMQNTLPYKWHSKFWSHIKIYEVCPIRVLHWIYSEEPSQGGPWSLYTPLVDVWNEYRFFGTWVGSRVGLESSNFWIINHQVMGVNPKIWENPPNHPYLFGGFPWNKPSILGFLFPLFLETSIYFQRNTYHQLWLL